MSNISRRQFLKGAGVATLAVAAAGMLAGCSKEDVPVVPGVTSETVEIRFTDDAGNVLATDKMEVLKSKTAVYFGEISLENLPKGYGVLGVSKLDDVLEVKNDSTGRYVVVNIKKGEIINAEDKDDSEVTLKTVRVQIWETNGNKTTDHFNVLVGERVCFDDIKTALEADFPGKTALNPAWRSKIVFDAGIWVAEVPLMIG